jgi:cell cycle related kinase
LYGARHYTEAVDLWASGCIFGEMLNGNPLFPGQSDIEQLYVVLSTLGTPSEEEWPVRYPLVLIGYNPICKIRIKQCLWRHISDTLIW